MLGKCPCLPATNNNLKSNKILKNYLPFPKIVETAEPYALIETRIGTINAKLCKNR